MIIFFLVLWQWLLVVITGHITNSMERTVVAIDSPTSPKRLTLNFQVDGIVTTINLKSSNQVLANEFLPVWITTGIPNLGFTKLNIMDEFGEFTVYHDDCTKSAFVYRHKTHELFGVINIRYYIKRLPIDETKEVHQVQTKYLHRITRNKRHTRESSPSIGNETSCRIRRNTVPHMYPELLVAISHDTFRAIEQDSNSPLGIATVLHVLTIYNAADMLYRSMLSANIQLNIAGIIIEGGPNEWNFESRKSDSGIYIDVDFINSKISNFFWFYQYYFPQHSYDIIMYHTRNLLKDDTDDIILGLTIPTTDDYMFPLHYRKDRLNSVIRDFETYEHFKTIAHELAHIFGAAHDDEGPYRQFFDSSCGDSLMSEFRGCSKSCFEWSQQTKKEIAAFLRMPVSCNMKNYPRSLDLPLPKLVFSIDEQCECYGYHPKLMSATIPTDNKCTQPLECVSKNNENVYTTLPMDGTPCGSRRVCWDGACLQYPNL